MFASKQKQRLTPIRAQCIASRAHHFTIILRENDALTHWLMARCRHFVSATTSRRCPRCRLQEGARLNETPQNEHRCSAPPESPHKSLTVHHDDLLLLYFAIFLSSGAETQCDSIAIQAHTFTTASSAQHAERPTYHR